MKQYADTEEDALTLANLIYQRRNVDFTVKGYFCFAAIRFFDEDRAAHDQRWPDLVVGVYDMGCQSPPFSVGFFVSDEEPDDDDAAFDEDLCGLVNKVYQILAQRVPPEQFIQAVTQLNGDLEAKGVSPPVDFSETVGQPSMPGLRLHIPR